jgi:arylsulfatase I/J
VWLIIESNMLAVFLIALVCQLVAGQPVTDKPNIVMMLVDDWGWANVGYHRDPPTREVVTPNIDSLVKEGLELNQHYAFKFCSPSRSCLMSGSS